MVRTWPTASSSNSVRLRPTTVTLTFDPLTAKRNQFIVVPRFTNDKSLEKIHQCVPRTSRKRHPGQTHARTDRQTDDNNQSINQSIKTHLCAASESEKTQCFRHRFTAETESVFCSVYRELLTIYYEWVQYSNCSRIMTDTVCGNYLTDIQRERERERERESLFAQNMQATRRAYTHQCWCPLYNS